MHVQTRVLRVTLKGSVHRLPAVPLVQDERRLP